MEVLQVAFYSSSATNRTDKIHSSSISLKRAEMKGSKRDCLYDLGSGFRDNQLKFILHVDFSKR